MEFISSRWDIGNYNFAALLFALVYFDLTNNILFQYFLLFYRLIVKCLIDKIEEYAKSAPIDSSWLYCVPLLHFLRHDSNPFKIVSSKKHRTKEWWGLQFLRKAKKNLKSHIMQQSGVWCQTDGSEPIWVHSEKWNMYVHLLVFVLFVELNFFFNIMTLYVHTFSDNF